MARYRDDYRGDDRPDLSDFDLSPAAEAAVIRELTDPVGEDWPQDWPDDSCPDCGERGHGGELCPACVARCPQCGRRRGEDGKACAECVREAADMARAYREEGDGIPF